MSLPFFRRLSPKWRRMILFSLILPAAALVVWVIHTNVSPVLTTVTVSVEGLPQAFDGFRILQVSDLHDAELGQDHERTMDLIREADPDIILITGDFVDSHRTDVALSLSFAEQAVQIAPCYYVTGNHEGRISAETYAALEEGLLSLGVTVLHGEAITLERGGASITLAGVDSPAFGQDAASGEETVMPLSELCGEGFSILLAHHPEYAADYAAAGADLIFSGHVHGGQFRLPFVGGLYGPGQGLFPAYDAGLYTIPTDGGNALLYVSRGLGNSRIPVRFANRPEVILAVLESQ